MNKEAVLNKAKLEKNEEFENTVSQKLLQLVQLL